MARQPGSKKDVLAAAGVFASLTSLQLEQIASLSDERHIPAGQTLCRQHDFGTDVFVIASGRLSVVVDGIEVASVGASEVVGDWALFGSGYRTATLLAVTPVDVVVVDPQEIDSLLMAVPAAARVLGPHALQPAR